MDTDGREDIGSVVIDFTDGTGLEIPAREVGEAGTTGEDVIDVEGVSYVLLDTSFACEPGRTH